MLEQWRDVVGHDGYQVSNLGNIRSLDRKVRCEGGERTSRGRVLTPFLAKGTGYMQIDLSRKRFSVHRLVAMAWCDGFFKGAWVDHVNGDKTDNRAENLDWVTPSENSTRSFAAGRINPCKGKFSEAHPASKPVISKCIKTGKEVLWNSGMDAVRQGFKSSCIAKCCKGQRVSHKGYTWRYAEVTA